MFKGMKKVLAGLMAAAIALTPVSSAFAATSPVVSLGPVSKKHNVPATAKGKSMIADVQTTNSGAALIGKVNTSATTFTFTNVAVANGKYYYTTEDGRKHATGKTGTITYKIGAVKKGAFVGAVNAQKVTLGTKFEQGRLEYKCFAGARSLKYIYIKSRSIKKVGTKIFGNNVDPSKIVIYVPKATTNAQLARFQEQFTRNGVKKANIKRATSY